MAYIVRPDGSIVAETVKEAIALSRELARVQRGAASSAAAREAPVAQNGEGGFPAFLAALVEAGPGGITSHALADKVGMDPRGLSGFAIRLKNQIKKKGHPKTESFFKAERKIGQPTLWTANPEKLRQIGLVQ